MLPHYQNRSLEYDNRINRQINQRLKKKYANLAPVNFTANNPDAEAVYTDLEKTLFLIFALLQEAQTYLFEAPNHENDISEQQSDYTQPSSVSYSDSDAGSFSDDSSFFDRNSQFEARRQQMGNDLRSEYDLSSAYGSFNGNLAEQTRQQKVISTVGSFRGVLSKIIQTTPSLSSLVKQITPLFSYLSQTQVDTIQQIVLGSINLFTEIATAVANDLGETNKTKSVLYKSLDLINEGIIQKNLTLLGRLYQNYSPIIVPSNVSSINDTGTGYSLADGVDNGSYV